MTTTPQPPQPLPRPTPRAAAASRLAFPPSPYPIDLHLDANEGKPPPLDLAAIASAFGINAVRRYPATSALQASLAQRHALSPSRILLTAGGDEAIDRACRAFLEPGRDLILPVPTFEMIPRYAALTGASVLTVPWSTAAYPIDAVLSRVTDRTAMIAVVSPNNPTGAVATPDDLRSLAAAAPHALLLVDLAYCEFADVDLTPAALALPNTLVIRTFSKAFGLAGLRVGYALASDAIINTLAATASTFPVSSLSAAVASAALATAPNWMPPVIDRIRLEREQLASALRATGARAEHSQANFVLAHFPDGPARWLALAKQGIATRRLSPASNLPNALRITCPCDQLAFPRLLAAVRTA